MDDYISTEIDSFIEDKDGTIWICELSNGLTVYQDDDRPDMHHSAWHRLKNYCHNNKVNILNIKIKFRSHIETVASSNEGYFFCKHILFGPAMTKAQEAYIVGDIHNGILRTRKYIVPEIVEMSSEERDIDKYLSCIILCTNQN